MATLTGTPHVAAQVATAADRPVRPRRVEDPGLIVDALLAAVPDHQVTEVVELAARGLVVLQEEDRFSFLLEFS